MCVREVCKGWKGNMLSVVCVKWLDGGSRRVARGVQVFREKKRNERVREVDVERCCPS